MYLFIYLSNYLLDIFSQFKAEETLAERIQDILA